MSVDAQWETLCQALKPRATVTGSELTVGNLQQMND